MSDEFKVMYQFTKTMRNSGIDEHPDDCVQITFDGTDSTLDSMLAQYEKFLRAAGYHFDYLEVVNNEQT
jgi:hypothetical protein